MNDNVIPLKRPVNFDNLRSNDAESIIRERAKVSENVIVTDHAFDRVEEREITTVDMHKILNEGYVLEAPIKNEEGEWEAIIQKRMRGTRDAGVVTIILTESDELIVKTVEWMDISG